MTEIERLELAKSKAIIEFYGWSASDLGLTVDSSFEDKYEKLNDGNVFTALGGSTKKMNGHYIAVVQGDRKLEDHNFEAPSSEPLRIYISQNVPFNREDEYELFRVKK